MELNTWPQSPIQPERLPMRRSSRRSPQSSMPHLRRATLHSRARTCSSCDLTLPKRPVLRTGDLAVSYSPPILVGE